MTAFQALFGFVGFGIVVSCVGLVFAWMERKSAAAKRRQDALLSAAAAAGAYASKIYGGGYTTYEKREEIQLRSAG